MILELLFYVNYFMKENMKNTLCYFHYNLMVKFSQNTRKYT